MNKRHWLLTSCLTLLKMTVYACHADSLTRLKKRYVTRNNLLCRRNVAF